MRFAALLFAPLVAAQVWEQRGFIESRNYFYPQDAFNDSGNVTSELLFRYEGTWRARPWLKLTGAFDARSDSHRQVARDGAIDWDGRQTLRPAFSARRFSATLNKGPWTLELGRQFIRWGKADILNPTDRFAPKDFLNVFDSDLIGVNAARLTWERKGDTLDIVFQPRFTPARAPLLNQRWVVIPEQFREIPFRDAGARYPGGAQTGLRWNHVGAGYEFAVSFFDGRNYLPLLDPEIVLQPDFAVNVQRRYPRLRQYGGEVAVPLKWFTVKGEAGWYTAPSRETQDFWIYVIQVERTVGEWVFVGGYAGEAVTRSGGPQQQQQQFAPDRGFAKSFVGHVGYTLGPTRNLNFDAVVRAKASWVRGEFSQTFGQHWRVTAGVAWLRGDPADFIGQYQRNSNATLAIRYSF